MNWEEYYKKKKNDPEIGPMLERAEERLKIITKLWHAAQAGDVETFSEAEEGLGNFIGEELAAERKRVVEEVRQFSIIQELLDTQSLIQVLRGTPVQRLSKADKLRKISSELNTFLDHLASGEEGEG